MRRRVLGLTIQSLRRGRRLEQAKDALHAPLELFILCLDGIANANDVLQLLKRLLAFEFLDAAFKILNRVLGPFPDGALGLSVVCSLLCKLFGRQVGHSSRRCAIGLALPAILHRHVRCPRPVALAYRCIVVVGRGASLVLVTCRGCAIVTGRPVNRRHVVVMCYTYEEVYSSQTRVTPIRSAMSGKAESCKFVKKKRLDRGTWQEFKCLIFCKSAGIEVDNLSFVNWFRRDFDGTRKSNALLCHGKKTRREIEGQGANIVCESVLMRRIGAILTLTNHSPSAHLPRLILGDPLHRVQPLRGYWIYSTICGFQVINLR